MLSKITSGAVLGVEGYVVDVEVDISDGLPAFDIVGLPDSSVKESRERVRTAIKNVMSAFPVKRITVNLAPADTKKEGSAFDLPIAVAILSCMGVIDPQKTVGAFFAGELSLDGGVRHINGVLPMVHKAAGSGVTKFFIPSEDGDEAALVDGVEVYGVKSIAELVKHFRGEPLERITVNTRDLLDREADSYPVDFSDVKGQDGVKRALEIAAAGYHNALMIGPPGSGKTMMAKRLPTIMPGLSFAESLDVTRIYSVAGLLKKSEHLVTARPFRAPHHTASYTALTGGGASLKPGEISFAHNGVLFLDELPEFHRNVLEALRQPLEDRFITVTRASGTVTYPSNFMLLASMNPCPCGYFGNSSKCTCTQNEISRYLNKISGPLLDRIDIHVEAAANNYSDFESKVKPESSADIKRRVVAAHERQRERYKGSGISFNSELSPAQTEVHCRLGRDEKDILRQAFSSLGLSARAYHRILRTARTIADLDGSENIRIPHLAEAIQYRNLDRKYW